MGLCSSNELVLGNEQTSTVLSKLQMNDTMVEIVYGHYKSQRAEYLVTIIQEDNLKNNQILNSCIAAPQDAINRISGGRKIVQVSSPPKGFAYKKVITCVMPNYDSVTPSEYKQKFKQILHEVFSKGKDFMFVFNQTHEFHNLPNQMLIYLLLLSLRQKDKEHQVSKVRLISQQRNMCCMFKLQTQKAMGSEWQSESYKSTNIPRMEI